MKAPGSVDKWLNLRPNTKTIDQLRWAKQLLLLSLIVEGTVNQGKIVSKLKQFNLQSLMEWIALGWGTRAYLYSNKKDHN